MKMHELWAHITGKKKDQKDDRHIFTYLKSLLANQNMQPNEIQEFDQFIGGLSMNPEELKKMLAGITTELKEYIKVTVKEMVDAEPKKPEDKKPDACADTVPPFVEQFNALPVDTEKSYPDWLNFVMDGGGTDFDLETMQDDGALVNTTPQSLKKAKNWTYRKQSASDVKSASSVAQIKKTMTAMKQDVIAGIAKALEPVVKRLESCEAAIKDCSEDQEHLVKTISKMFGAEEPVTPPPNDNDPISILNKRMDALVDVISKTINPPTGGKSFSKKENQDQEPVDWNNLFN